MAWIKLPLVGSPYKNLEDLELEELSPVVQDAYVNEAGHTVKRPGLSSFISLGTGASIDGLFWWAAQGVLIAVSAGRIWKITDITGTKVELSSGSALLQPNARVTFDQDGTRLLMANGGKMVWATTAAGSAIQMADADAPTLVTHVCIHDQFALANNVGTTRFSFSDVGDLTNWRPQDLLSAEAKTDNIRGLFSGLQGIVVVGEETTEFWVDDGVSPFSRIRGLTTDIGTAAGNSIAGASGNYFWLDNKRGIARINANGQFIQTPFPYHKQTFKFPVVTDAVGDCIDVNGIPFYLLHLPSARVTYAFNYRDNTWAEWGTWDTSLGTYQRFRGNCYAHSSPWNMRFMGDYVLDNIYLLSEDSYDDAGTAIRMQRRTGFITHDTKVRKRCNAIRMTVKRVQTSSVTAPKLMVRWRNEDQVWKNEHWFDLGPTGNTELMLNMHNCGAYRARQYEFTLTDNVGFVMTNAEEDITLLTR